MGDRITFVGHSTVLIELGGARILTDPLLRDRFLLVRRQVAPPEPRHYQDLDAVLISHLHHDHLDFPSLRRIGKRTPLVVGRGGARVLRWRGFRHVTELTVGETVGVGEVEVEAIDAFHDGRRLKIGPRVDAVGFLLTAERGVYFAADTDLFPGMSELAGSVDVALLPVGGWGPTVGKGHLDPERAAEAAAAIRPRLVVPIHWGTYLRPDLARRRPDLLRSYAGEFEAEVETRVPGVGVRVLEPGEALDLDSGSSGADV